MNIPTLYTITIYNKINKYKYVEKAEHSKQNSNIYLHLYFLIQDPFNKHNLFLYKHFYGTIYFNTHSGLEGNFNTMTYFMSLKKWPVLSYEWCELAQLADRDFKVFKNSENNTKQFPRYLCLRKYCKWIWLTMENV